MATGTPKVKLNSKGQQVKKPYVVENGKKFYEGVVFTSEEGYKYIILDYNKAGTKIRFLDNGYECIVNTQSAVDNHRIKNPYKPFYMGNYIGPGEYGRKKDVKAYQTWYHMHTRVYESENKISTDLDHYKHVYICEEWYNFQNFAQWYYNQLSILNPDFLYTIDKDILQWNQNEKIYSPKTCVMIPRELNAALSNYKNLVSRHGLPTGVRRRGRLYYAEIQSNLFTDNFDYNRHGFETPEEAFDEYKRAKITYIREKADYYYKNNAISQQVRDALYNIEIVPYSDSQIDIMNQGEIARTEINKKHNIIEDLNDISQDLENIKKSIKIGTFKNDIEIIQEKIRSSITKNK